MRKVLTWGVVLALVALCACARTEPPASRMPTVTGDAFACQVEIRAETSMAGRRDVYRVVSAMRYVAGPVKTVRVLSREAKAYRGDDDARPFAATPGASSPVGTAAPENGVDDARAVELAADGHALYVAALERRSKRESNFPVRLASPDGKVRDVVLKKAAETPEGSWSGDGADAATGDGAKPIMADAPTLRVPAEVVAGVRAVTLAVTSDASAQLRVAVDFDWPALGDAPSRFEMRVGPALAAQ